MFKEGTKNYLVVSLIIVITLSVVVFWFFYKPTNYLEVDFLDVGQGDAELIKTPHGQTILVDGGPDKKVLQRLGETLPFWQNKIDLVILTHPHDDHFGGLSEVLKRYQVKNLLFTNVLCKDLGYQNFLKIVNENKVNKIIMTGPDKFTLDEVSFILLYPRTSLAGQTYKNANNTSIVFQLNYKDINFLLTGDAEKEVEKELINVDAKDLSAQILKLGHHGSDTSSTENFLKAVKPLVGIISVGANNKFGHPVPIILERLKRLGIEIKRTDQEGTIKALTNGQWLSLDKTCLIANCPL
jgi:competence protein ComEC